MNLFKRRDVKLAVTMIITLLPFLLFSRYKIGILVTGLLLLSVFLAEEYQHQPAISKTITIGVVALASAVAWNFQTPGDYILGAIFFIAIMVYRLRTMRPAH